MVKIELTEIERDNFVSALEDAIENTSELLQDHEAMLGRTTTKNRLTAERLEKEKSNLKSVLSKLKNT